MSDARKYVLLTICSALFIVGLCISSKVKLLVVHSGSLPYRVMVLVKGSEYKKGDYVTVERHQPLYLQDEFRLTKKVAGMPGDRIVIINQELFVEKEFIGELHPKNSQGKKLTPLQIPVIPQGYIFLKGEHPDSYDSRYAEFGLVKTEHIVGRSWPLF